MAALGMEKMKSATKITSSNLAEFQDSILKSFVPLKVRSPHHLTFGGQIKTRSLGEISVSEICAAGHNVERTQALIAQGDINSYKVSLLLSGEQAVSQDSREAILQPGDIAVYDTSRPYHLSHREDVRLVVLRFPKKLLGLPESMVRRLTAVRLSGDSAAGALISPFLIQLANSMDQLGDAAASRLSYSALDLITAMMSSELDLSADTVNPRDVLLEKIRTYIKGNLSSPDLCPAEIAAAHFISVRHLHGIFHEQGTTVSAWIRARRLENCRRDLRDPLFSHESVTEISSRWGFLDSAHFSRVYKARFSISPSEERHTALGRSPGLPSASGIPRTSSGRSLHGQTTPVLAKSIR